MPHMQWNDQTWSDEPCSSEETDARYMEMKGILDAINRLLGFDPNSPSALAERKAQADYSKAVDEAKRDYYSTMEQALHDYHEARRVKRYENASEIGKVYDGIGVQATRKYSSDETEAYKNYKKASIKAKEIHKLETIEG